MGVTADPIPTLVKIMPLDLPPLKAMSSSPCWRSPKDEAMSVFPYGKAKLKTSLPAAMATYCFERMA